METAAKKCGLSLSAYLRKLGLGKEVQATLPQEFYEAYRGLTSLRDNWKSLSEANVNANFNDVVSKLLKAYHSIGEPVSASDSPWQYKLLADYDKRNAFDIEKYRSHKLVVKPTDTFDLYDMGEIKED